MQQVGKPPADEKVRVLIVDDDRDWCEAAQIALEVEGIFADAVHTGDAAVDLLVGTHYDAAIVDVQMPGRGGVDVVRELRDVLGPQLPIIIATAMPAAAGVCAGLLAGADDEFFKCDPNEDIAIKLRRLWRARAH